MPWDVTWITDPDRLAFLDGHVAGIGNNKSLQLGHLRNRTESVFIDVSGVHDVLDIDVGWSHCIALRRDGKVSVHGASWQESVFRIAVHLRG